MNAHSLEETNQFLKEKFGLFVFDSTQGTWR
jgi:hypothetical protein